MDIVLADNGEWLSFSKTIAYENNILKNTRLQ